MLEYTSLPEEYRSVIREKLPPEPKPGVHGRPFWCTKEAHDVYYENEAFVYYSKKHHRGERISVEVNMKGFFVVGCEPGSGPQPFIIVSIDNETGKIGFILPYVYIINQDNDIVDLKVGADMTDYSPDHYIEGTFDTYEEEAVKQISNKYKIQYYDKDTLTERWLGFCVGSFGNYGLPGLDKDDKYEVVI
jgi:hypothetical protein